VIDEHSNFIGETDRYKVYLYYKPDVSYLRNAALTLDMVKELPNSDKIKLIFAPTAYVDSEHLQLYNVQFVRLPFEIYRFPSSSK